MGMQYDISLAQVYFTGYESFVIWTWFIIMRTRPYLDERKVDSSSFFSELLLAELFVKRISIDVVVRPTRHTVRQDSVALDLPSNLRRPSLVTVVPRNRPSETYNGTIHRKDT
jgi:hypothetical protein